jgi:uncharacterized protein
MKIVIAGGSGFIGSHAVPALAKLGEVVVLSRSPRDVAGARVVVWDPRGEGEWQDEVATAGAVVNLAGENLAEGRWTAARMERLVASRIDPTSALVRAMRAAPDRERVFVSSSAVGVYGDRGDEILEETSAPGDGFVASLCRGWEKAAGSVDDAARLVILRFGVVIAHDGGMLEKLLLPFRLGAGGRIGSGRQWLSWIAAADAVRLIVAAVERQELAGVFNATAPRPVTNAEFTRFLARALRRPALVPIPAAALELAFGKMAREVLLASQRAVPRRAIDEELRIEEEDLGALLEREVRRNRP